MMSALFIDRWQAKGALWLSDVRMVFVAAGPVGRDGLQAFDIPLAYVSHDKFNQPVFGCNHLSGERNCPPCAAALCAIVTFKSD